MSQAQHNRKRGKRERLRLVGIGGVAEQSLAWRRHLRRGDRSPGAAELHLFGEPDGGAQLTLRGGGQRRSRRGSSGADSGLFLREQPFERVQGARADGGAYEFGAGVPKGTVVTFR